MAAIQANVTNQQIGVTVGETQIDVAVSGGVGPTGPSGTVSVSAPITNSGTSTAATIGLSTGTGLAVSGGSLTVSYGATAGTACQGNDARLSDSREWSASTVTQADAEAGTSTSRFAFTPLRVFQAIAAWWAGSAAKTKLDGIAAGATANATDAQLRDRSTHTGTQTASTISDFTSAVVAAAPPTTNASLLTSGTLDAARLPGSVVLTTDARLSDARTPLSHTHDDRYYTEGEVDSLLAGKQAAGTYATLVGGKVPAEQLPSYVDDIIEAANLASLPGTGASGVLYVTLDTNKVYRWSGSAYVEVSAGASSWSDITGKPSFAAVATSGAYSDLAGTPAAYSLPTATGSVLGGVRIGSGVTIDGSGVISVSTAYAAASHSHAIADVTGLQTALDGKQASGSYAATVHTHGISDVTGLQTALDGKAASLHTHSAADITSGTVAAARLGSGTPSASNFLRGDGTWAAAGSSSASDLTSGTLADARLSANARQAIDNLLHPFLLAGM